MLGDISGLEKIYIACNYTDKRKFIDGLCVVIEGQIKIELLFSALFLFYRRRRERLKALFRELDCHSDLQAVVCLWRLSIA